MHPRLKQNVEAMDRIEEKGRLLSRQLDEFDSMDAYFDAVADRFQEPVGHDIPMDHVADQMAMEDIDIMAETQPVQEVGLEDQIQDLEISNQDQEIKAMTDGILEQVLAEEAQQKEADQKVVDEMVAGLDLDQLLGDVPELTL